MVPGHMILSGTWILMMTGNSPNKRFDRLLLTVSFLCVYFTDQLQVKVSDIHCVPQVKEYLKKEFLKHGYSPNDTHHEVMVEDIFKHEDEDEDGFISAREFTIQHDEL